MALNDIDKELISTEEAVVQEVLKSLNAQHLHDQSRFGIETQRARTLTSAIVNTRRAEDKAMLASDEAVAHGLSAKKKEDISVLEKLMERPYFGRIVLEEEDDRGQTKIIEYKLGIAANPDCRIVDWRKAPIAKLFYEYKEGDEYSEEIQGRERTGKVVLRRTVEIEHGVLRKVSTAHVSFERRGSDWVRADRGAIPKKTGGLPDVLSLVTAEQFRAITEEATSAVLIQGIAGSGKTTVALYRLAWLLHHENSSLQPHECIVVVLSPALRAYVKNALPALGVNGVRILTFDEFAAETLREHLPAHYFENGRIRRPTHASSRSVLRAKHSMALLAAVEEYGRGYATRTTWTSYADDLLSVLARSEQILRADDSKLLSRELLAEALAATKSNLAAGTLDSGDEALLLRLIEIKQGGVNLRARAQGHYGHIVADEVQDLSAPQLAAIVGAVKNASALSIVGDVSQSLDQHSSFPGWDKLRSHWAFKDVVSKFLSLSVSHRSTLPIMKLADYVLGRDLVQDGRTGRVPLWLACRTEALGIEHVRDWLKKAQERYPGDLAAVVCADKTQAKFALDMLKPTFGASIREGDDESFSFDSGIVVTQVRQVKGLEFTNVLLWNPTTEAYPDDLESKNALYIAISRAQENLCIVNWRKPASQLPPLSSPLVRGMKMGFDAE